MKLFVGLGNPGEKYARHRHNVGVMALDRIAQAHDAGPWRRRFQGETTELNLGGERVVLLKPTTYMNESGRSVGEAQRFLKIPVSDVYVFHDEIDLAPSKVKVKTGGGNAGHNGLRSITAYIGNDYNRVRIGVGHPGVKEVVPHYVLHDFAKAEYEWLEPLLEAMAESARYLAQGDSARFLSHVAKIERGNEGRPETSSSAAASKERAAPKPHPAGERATKRASVLAENLKKWLSGRGHMAALFDERVRTSRDPLRPGGRLFEFYDSCGRPGYDTFREIVNSWISELPEDDRVALIKQMRTGTNSQFQAGLSELLVHAMLKRKGYSVRCHPTLPHTDKTPDFAAYDSKGNLLAYVEVTTNNPTQDEVGCDNREAAIRNAINKANLPEGCRLGYRVVRHGSTSPPLKALLAEIEKWADENKNQPQGKHPARVFDVSDWQIEIELYAGFKGAARGHSIVAVTGNMRWLEPALDTRYRLEQKSKRYGELDAPYVIVVADCAEQVATHRNGVRDALIEAVFGDEVFVASLESNDVELRRKRNGFFGSPDNPKNAHVSAVLLLPDAGLWHLRDKRCQPMIAINPWASAPLSHGFLPLPRLKIREGGLGVEPGTAAADILGIPTAWPPEG